MGRLEKTPSERILGLGNLSEWLKAEEVEALSPVYKGEPPSTDTTLQLVAGDACKRLGLISAANTIFHAWVREDMGQGKTFPSNRRGWRMYSAAYLDSIVSDPNRVRLLLNNLEWLKRLRLQRIQQNGHL